MSILSTFCLNGTKSITNIRVGDLNWLSTIAYSFQSVVKYVFTALFVVKLNHLQVKCVDGRNGYIYSINMCNLFCVIMATVRNRHEGSWSTELSKQLLYSNVGICGRILSLFGHACISVPIELIYLSFRR
jgi:hypothetical protein